MPKTVTIVLGGAALEVTPDPTGNNIKELYPKANILGVTGMFNQKPVTAQEGEWSYPYLTQTELQINMNDGITVFKIELQDVSNQATWNLGTKAALQQAIADINAWL